MRDIPVFATDNGVASLALRQIPYRGEAFVRVQDSCAPDAFVEECAAFCHAAGAARVYAAGSAVPARYPLYTEIWQMTCPRAALLGAEACAVPVTADTLPAWQACCNARMRGVPAAAFFDASDAGALLARGGAYFIQQNGAQIGIGEVSDACLRVVAATKPGAGETVVRTLAGLLAGETVSLETASENSRALRLYLRLGFRKTAVLTRWFTIFEECQGKPLDKARKMGYTLDCQGNQLDTEGRYG